MFPRILHIYGPLWINGYGLMIAIGFLLFIFLTYRHPQRPKIISSDLFFNMMFLGLISAIVGGRLFFILSEWDLFEDNWLEMFYPWVGGFGLLGSIIAVLVAVPLYLKLHKIAILPFLDIAVIYVPLMQAVARIGCFLAGCCYGSAVDSSLWYSVVFTNQHGLAPLYVPLHPAQLYSSAVSFIIFLIIYLREKFFSFKRGEILFTYLLLESLARFTVDFWRGQRSLIVDFYWAKSFFALFSYSQLVAFFIFIFALSGLVFVTKKK